MDLCPTPFRYHRRTGASWQWTFDQNGTFEVALRKSAFPAPAPQCRMPYLILAMPNYYPENPKQAPLSDRRTVYDTLLAMQETGKGTLRVKAEASYYVRKGASGLELTTCNIYFALPLDWVPARTECACLRRMSGLSKWADDAERTSGWMLDAVYLASPTRPDPARKLLPALRRRIFFVKTTARDRREVGRNGLPSEGRR